MFCGGKMSEKPEFIDQLSCEEQEFDDLRSLKTLVFSCLNKNSFSPDEIASYNEKNYSAEGVIDNFYQVNAGYYRGALPDVRGLEHLIEHVRIKTIIDLRFLSKKQSIKREQAIKSAGLDYVNIPMTIFFPPAIRQVEEFLEIVNNPDNQPVYVHCLQGKDRTGIMTAIYRVVNYGYSYDSAYAEMLKFGHHAMFLPFMRMGLRKFCGNMENVYSAGVIGVAG